HPIKRIIIAVAGPFFNLLFAFMSFTAIAMIGYTYYSPSATIVLADEVYPEVHSAAREAGLLTGDTIVKINNHEIQDFSDIAAQIGIHPDEDVTIVVNRDGTNLSFKVHTDIDKSEGVGKIGVASKPHSVQARHTKTYSFFPAMIQGAKECANMIWLTLKSITILFKGIDVTNAVSGPARITSMLGDTVESGFKESFNIGIVSTLQLLALISISLFIMNLLPIPILDGGLVLFAFIELIIKRQIPPKILYYVQYIGIAFIAFLLVLGITGDVRYFARFLEKK
ncbi:MAG: site-2 protease family protein, partial [Treponema sp.]|nr:site-2 protease family protein [Treponema sp.]